MRPIPEKIRYGYTNDIARMPTAWTDTYKGAVSMAESDQPANGPYFIIEKCEHYEVCGTVGDEIYQGERLDNGEMISGFLQVDPDGRAWIHYKDAAGYEGYELEEVDRASVRRIV